jgi:hypothetical protein
MLEASKEFVCFHHKNAASLDEFLWANSFSIFSLKLPRSSDDGAAHTVRYKSATYPEPLVGRFRRGSIPVGDFTMCNLCGIIVAFVPLGRGAR